MNTHIHTISFKDNPDVDKEQYNDYNILIGKDILPGVLTQVKEEISPRRQAIIADGNVVGAGHLKKLDPEGKTPTFIVKPDLEGGVESKKNHLTYGDIIDFLDNNKFEKKDTLICLGGGVIGDMGGFVAATYKRGGMTYIQVPTTTLSLADSSVGGKCAIDSTYSKNSAGGFYQPHFVVQDIVTLDTLDDRNFRSGLVESVKHGIILDGDYFGMLEAKLFDIFGRDPKVLSEVSLKNVKLKGDVVQVDPTEKNYRRSLNFGHTLGHAVEIASGFKLYHGEAVSLGILGAMHMSQELGLLSSSDLTRVEKLLIAGLGMPKKVPNYVNRLNVQEAILKDKKVVDGVPHYVLVNGIGSLNIVDGQYATPVPKPIVMNALDYIFKK